MSVYTLLVDAYRNDVHIIDWDVYSSIHKNAHPSQWMKISNQKSVKEHYNYVWHQLIKGSLFLVDKKMCMITVFKM